MNGNIIRRIVKVGMVVFVAVGLALLLWTVTSWRKNQADNGLLRAVRDDDCHQIELLLRDGADANARQIARQTNPQNILGWLQNLFHPYKRIQLTAIQVSLSSPRADTEAAQLLLRHGAKASVVDAKGRTLIDYVIDNYGASENTCVRLLLENGCSRVGKHGDLFDIAAEWNDVALMQLALRYGADPSQGSVLIVAIHNGNLDIVSMLLHCGADPNKADRYGHYPLTEAVKETFDMEGQTKTPQTVQRSIVQTLLKNGADPRTPDATGKSAFEYAREQHNKALLELLRTRWHHEVR